MCLVLEQIKCSKTKNDIESAVSRKPLIHTKTLDTQKQQTQTNILIIS